MWFSVRIRLNHLLVCVREGYEANIQMLYVDASIILIILSRTIINIQFGLNIKRFAGILEFEILNLLRILCFELKMSRGERI